VQIGVVYPQIELGGDPSAVRRIGEAFEDLEFDYLLAYDHVLGAVHADRTPQLSVPFTEHDPFHDPFVMFGYLAGVRTRWPPSRRPWPCIGSWLRRARMRLAPTSPCR
jgi:hypothetical protein